MHFLITAAPDPEKERRETGEHPSPELFDAYMRFNEEMARAGVLIASEGVNPARQGARVGVKDDKRVLLDGPFTATKELVGGFYLIDVASLDDAVAWALRCPTGLGSDDVLTILPLTGEGDIPPELVARIREVAPTWAASWSKR